MVRSLSHPSLFGWHRAQVALRRDSRLKRKEMRKTNTSHVGSLVFMVLVGTNFIAPALGADQRGSYSDSISVHGFIDRPSVDTAQVFVTMHGIRFVIPRNDLLDATIGVSGTAALKLTMLLPDFEGATSETINCFYSGNWKDCPRIVQVSLPSNEGPPGNKSAGIPSVESERGLSHEMVYGLAKAKHILGGYLYFGKNKSDDFLIACSTSVTGLDKCLVHGTVADRIDFVYAFHESQLAHWREIDSGVNQKLNMFLAGRE